MKVYTRGGDKGDTQVYADDVLRMRKDADVLECYGTLDELNAHVGLLGSLLHDTLTEPREQLLSIQRHLFQIGFAISATTSLKAEDISTLETWIDQYEDTLPAQTKFILPGGSKEAAQAHVCRTVARRAERTLVSLIDKHPVPPVCLTYLNRVSDYFYVLARYLNHAQNVPDINV
ncbi:cob(I)yrinic acid a,c-diamide adenosyltransferase [Aestuariibacter salexigens]|uniref:cob(I)yrinic acid a,c-diamide adenosyltransferase n=1 Tax=Aestuariibacter salexigens TaxID=226010 RepID=UPI0004049703|nr:cob(I)yrinic acid a,c-diamide adenosyltransferase [Aestuariibacter salexigens]